MDEKRIDYSLGGYEDDVRRSSNNLHKKHIVQRIWEKDYTVWKSSPDEITDRLGWLAAPTDTMQQMPYISAVLAPIIREGYKDAVLLGMGGSSLAAEVFASVFGNCLGHPRLHILDTTDPAAIHRLGKGLNLAATLFLVSSKSGTTLETLSLFNYFYNLTINKLGSLACRNFIVITDPASPLEELAYRLSLRHVFLNNPNVGGRYSALTLAGMVPAVLIGVDGRRLLEYAQATAENEQRCSSLEMSAGTGAELGAILGALALKKCDKLVLLFPDKWKTLGAWLEQLIAESTGKGGKGIMPVCALQEHKLPKYDCNHLFVVYDDGADADLAEYADLMAAAHPLIKIKINDAYEIGGHMFLWEMATAVAGHILNINPFDQPDVEATKIATRRMIETYREEKKFPPERPSLSTPEWLIYGGPKSASGADALKNFLAAAKSGDYVYFQVYLTPSAELDALLHKLCAIIGDKYFIAATSGYGPRYLHSTGQLHKGDDGRGLFIQMTADDPLDIEIPDQPGNRNSSLSFGVLKQAQAMGDRQALTDLGRRVMRMHLQKNVVSTLDKLANQLSYDD